MISFQDTCKHVGASKFYEDVDVGKADVSPMTPQSPKEKQDHMKPTDSDEEGKRSKSNYFCSHFFGILNFTVYEFIIK